VAIIFGDLGLRFVGLVLVEVEADAFMFNEESPLTSVSLSGFDCGLPFMGLDVRMGLAVSIVDVRTILSLKDGRRCGACTGLVATGGGIGLSGATNFEINFVALTATNMHFARYATG